MDGGGGLGVTRGLAGRLEEEGYNGQPMDGEARLGPLAPELHHSKA